MRERPILFSGPMVRAILEGRKTQTRRIVTGTVALEWLAPEMFSPAFVALQENGLCPYGAPGERLWVRETWRAVGPESGCTVPSDARFAASADEAELAINRWRPSIFMPRWASRLTLEVKAVRVERLQEITEADAMAEGAEERPAHGAMVGDLGRAGHWQFRQGFRELWDSINAKRGHGWETNPWVWVVEFERVAVS